jgi:octaprenyl-diphosphate synthase
MDEDLLLVERSLAALERLESSRIDGAARHLLEAGGKRLRPLLTCAFLRGCGGDPAPVADIVSAVELVHVGSLLHDDVIDAADVRRGRPAAHRRYDTHTAVLAGDLLLSRAFERLARGPSPKSLEVAMADTVRDLSVGEVLEREARFDLDDGGDRRVAAVLRTNSLKTASLIAYACEAGAILAGAPEEARTRCRAFGRDVGEAFQIVDDLLDWEGDPRVTGKPWGRDLSEGHVNLPAALGCASSRAVRVAVRAFWEAEQEGAEALLGQARLAAVRALLAEKGALEAARALAQERLEAALGALEAVPSPLWRARIAALGERMVDRAR